MANLSTKELNYIKDYLSWELLMAKKCNMYVGQEQNSDYKGVCNQAGQVHQQNYLNVLGYLQKVSNIQGGVKQ